MRWVEKISWDGSTYRVITVTKTGQRGNLPVSALHGIEWSARSARRVRITTDFQTWRQVSAETYLSGMGFSKDTLTGQDIYEFDAAGKEFQVPASVLMQGVFRPLRGLAPHLFKPQGLDNLVVARSDDGKDSVGFFVSPQTDIGIYPARSEGVVAALSWMYCFPSANRMWDSVLQNARSGRLALSLPQAKATLVLRALRRAGKSLVTDLTVVTLDTSEEPHAFAAGHSLHIEFHRTAQLKRNGPRSAPKPLDGLRSRNGNWHLSDAEWAVAESIVSKGQMRRHSLRGIVDCILDKLGRGVSWKSIQYGDVNQQTVVSSYQQMQKDGRWDSLVEAIQEMRSAILTQ